MATAIFTFALFALAITATAAYALERKTIARDQDWTLETLKSDGKKWCIASTTDRDEADLIVYYTTRTKFPTVSVMVLDGEDPNGPHSHLKVGTTSIRLRNIYPAGESIAGAARIAEDGEILADTARANNTAFRAIRHGKTAQYAANTSRGSTITFQFSLFGAKAMSNAAARECGVISASTTRHRATLPSQPRQQEAHMTSHQHTQDGMDQFFGSVTDANVDQSMRQLSDIIMIELSREF